MRDKKNKKLNFTLLIFLILFSFKTAVVKAANLPAEYNMKLIFNQKEKTLQGVQKVNIKNDLDAELKEIVFHLYPDSYNNYNTQSLLARSPEGDKKISEKERGDISIKKVSVDGNNVKYTEDNQILKITLKDGLKKNHSAEVYIEFTLKIPEGSGRLGYMDEVYSLTNWYPILSMYNVKENKWDENPFHPIGESNYSDIANYNIDIQVPNDFVVVSTGEEVEREKNKDNKIVALKAEQVRDFVIFMSPYYEVITKEIDGIKVNSYYIKDNQSKGAVKCAQKILDYAVDAVEFFSKKFGKYPYKELDILETYLAGGAMEYPQAIQMGRYSDELLDMDDTPFILEAIVHEVGHQWWYVTVGDNEFKEPFLDESITSFVTAYYFEQKYGEYSPNGILMSLREMYTEIDNRSNIKSKKISSSVDKFDGMYEYNITIYKKGALVFEDLRKRVGEENFLSIMQEYFNRFKFKNATIDGFLEIVEEKGGKEVRQAIDEAINREKYVPENLKLTPEETKKVSKERNKSYLLFREKSDGIFIESMALRGLKDEKIIVVIPSNLNLEEKTKVDGICDRIKDNQYGIDKNFIEIKLDKDIKEEDIKNNNLILLGNPWNNELINSNLMNLPITITKKGILGEEIILKGEGIWGAFICKNAKNNNKLILSLFWTESIPNFMEINSDTSDTIVVKMKDNKYFRGRI